MSGPCSTISAQNSWPKTQSAVASRAGTPTESMREVKWAKSASACRSDPQMPAESERTTTWPDDGTGIGHLAHDQLAIPGHRGTHATPTPSDSASRHAVVDYRCAR